MKLFASANMHISFVAEPVFKIGNFEVNNAMTLGAIGFIITLALAFYVANSVKKGKKNIFVSLFSWMFDSLYKQVMQVIPDKKVARSIAPLAITIFIFILVNYWLSILPGVGTITINGTPLFRGLPADLNFTLALAFVTVIAVQVYAIRQLGILANSARYIRNPFKDPVGAFEGLLELIGEFSRVVSLSLRLFGNAFAGEILLIVIAILAGYFSTLALPVIMAFELFIGFIQAYVFFILTLIFTSLAIEGHGDSDKAPEVGTSPKHSDRLKSSPKVANSGLGEKAG